MAKIISRERVVEYTKEFKVKIVQLTEVEGIQASLVAQGLGLHPVMLYRWRQEYREGRLVADPTRRVSMTMNKPTKSKPGKEPLSETERLKQEVARLKKENDLLKKWQRYQAEVKKNDSGS